MCKGAEVHAEAFEKLEAKLRHSHAQQGPGAWCLLLGALGRCWQ